MESRRRKDRWDYREKRETARQTGLHNQGRICPLLSTLAWGQRKIGTLKNVAFSDTQFRLIVGRKGVSVPLWRLLLPPARPLTLLSSYPSAGWFLPQIYKDKNAFHPSENKGNQVIADRFFPLNRRVNSECVQILLLLEFFFFFLRNQYAPPPTLERLDFPG